MSIMDLFRSPAAQQPAPAPTTQNGQQQQAAQPSLNPTQPTPDINGMSTESKEPVDPMDAFKDLWAPSKKEEGAEEEFNPSAIFNMDPASVQKAVSQIDFASSVTPEQLKAITEGGDGAVQAFAAAMNAVAQKTMSTATTASAKMIEQAMTRASGAMDKKITKQTTLNQLSSQLQESNPALSSPAAAPIIEGLKRQLVEKYPTATPTELNKLASDYLANFASLAAGKKETAPDQPVKTTGADVDWSAFMGS